MAEWSKQLMQVWQKIGKRERYLIMGTAALLFLVLLGWSYWWGGRPDYVPLFTNMEAKDAGEVVAKLKELKIDHKVDSNGTAILVSSKDVHKVRLDLASQGLPRGNKGFEIFDQNKFGASDFQNKVYYLQALQGELTRTIEQLAEVEKARVHIVMAEDSLYKKNEKPATASVMLKLRPSAQLSREQIKGIVNLVAHSVQGLKAENVTVVDNMARVLNDFQDMQMNAGIGTVTQMELTKKIKDELQKNIQSLLEQTLGQGKAVARVNVELDFDQRTLDRQVFAPVVDDKGIVRSSQENSENFKGTQNAPGGPPGTTSNIPGYVTPNNATGQSNYEKKEVTKNYEINETKEKVVSAPGSIKRVTVAVLADASISKEQQASIAKIVSSAAGVNIARGDVVSVESVPFSTEAMDKQKREEDAAEQQQKYALYLKIAAAVLLALMGVYFIRWYAQRREEEDTTREAAAAMAVEAEKISMQAKTKAHIKNEKEVQREELTDMITTRPADAAQLIKAWLSEEK